MSLRIEEGKRSQERRAHLADLVPRFFGEMACSRRTPQRLGDHRSPLTAVVMTGKEFRQIDRELPKVAEKIRKAIDERCRHLMAVE